MWGIACQSRLAISAGAIVLLAIVVSLYRNYGYVVDRQYVVSWPIKSDKAVADKQRTVVDKCRPRCQNGSFSLRGMDDCVPWLNCHHLTHVDILHQIGWGAVKQVYLGLWQGKYLAVSKPAIGDEGILYERDFKHGLQMLIQLGPHDRISQLVGFCANPLTILTEYHAFGDLLSLRETVESRGLIGDEAQKTRFQLCIDYAQVLTLLHGSAVGTRVMCDSSDLRKTLKQYLLSDDLRLVVNDLDALPRVDHQQGQLAKCGHRQLEGSFVAPEQRWPLPHIPYDDRKMPKYDEKSDIWKIPTVCEAFLYHSDDDVILFRLFSIHNKCKSIDPKARPSAVEVLDVYVSVWDDMFGKSDGDESCS